MTQSARKGTLPKKSATRETGTVKLLREAMKSVEKTRHPNKFMTQSGYKTGLKKSEEIL